MPPVAKAFDPRRVAQMRERDDRRDQQEQHRDFDAHGSSLRPLDGLDRKRGAMCLIGLGRSQRRGRPNTGELLQSSRRAHASGSNSRGQAS